MAEGQPQTRWSQHFPCVLARAYAVSMLMVLTGIPFLLTACTTPNIHKTNAFWSNPGVETLSIDAKQRVVIFSKDEDKKLTVTCAEPSPDALSALSSSLSGGVSDVKVALNLAFSQAESAASIGLRTQSIQLLRDGMYRLCEGYAAGALTNAEFNREQRRYQNLMLSLLAIEQLTGAVVPRQVGLGEGTASASAGDRADEAASNLAKANTDLESAQSAYTKAQDTQATDAKDCKADPPNTASCANAPNDQTAVGTAKTALDKATQTQKTNQAAMLAARAAVKAEAGGAVVHFSEAPKTNSISDSSARYIAEATRTIVSTTLLASFAQEECTNVWAFLERLPQSTQNQIAESAASARDADTTQGTKSSSEGGKEPATLSDELVQMAKNCQANQRDLIQQVSMFKPQYDSVQSVPLQVLNVQDTLQLAPKDKASLTLVGGVLPYHVSRVPPDLTKDLSAGISSAVNGLYALEIQRPDGATKISGIATLHVIDSAGAHVEVPVTLVAKATEKAPEASAAVAKISSVTGDGGKIGVKFVLSSPDKVDKISATATNVVASKRDPVLSQDGDVTKKEIDIEKCKDGESYNVELVVTPKGATKQVVKWAKPVKCMAAAGPGEKPPSAGGATVPGAPKIADAKALAGAKMSVTFNAPASDGGTPITSYTATAVNTKGGTKPVVGSTPDEKVAPIMLSGCTAGDSYVLTLVANNKVGPSQPAKADNPIKCEK